MSATTNPPPALPGWQADRLAVLLDALDGVVISDTERRTLTWLSGWEKHTVIPKPRGSELGASLSFPGSSILKRSCGSRTGSEL
ncbi:MAG: hypothetical protein ACRDT0_20900 [Pseudonocardiaceae bacterium]